MYMHLTINNYYWISVTLFSVYTFRVIRDRLGDYPIDITK